MCAPLVVKSSSIELTDWLIWCTYAQSITEWNWRFAAVALIFRDGSCIQLETYSSQEIWCIIGYRMIEQIIKRAVHEVNKTLKMWCIFMRQQQQSDLYRWAQGGRTSLPSVGSITILSVDTIVNGLITNFQSIKQITSGDGIKDGSHERNELPSQKLDVRFSRHLGIRRAHGCLHIVGKYALCQYNCFCFKYSVIYCIHSSAIQMLDWTDHCVRIWLRSRTCR